MPPAKKEKEKNQHIQVGVRLKVAEFPKLA